MEKPLISVVIPTYQHAQTIGVCIDSILGQTYSNIEIIVVNDGSIDNTIEVLEPYEGKIKLINQENQGSNFARNRGWREVSGEFVIFCDADVRMQPDMLEKMHRTLEKNAQASYVYSPFKFGWKLFRGVEFSAGQLKKENYIHTTSLVRKEDFPGFDKEIERLQDWDVWLTMLENKKTGVLIPEVLFDVEISGESRIGSSWLPSFVYRLPWRLIGWRPKRVNKYETARRIIAEKHNL